MRATIRDRGDEVCFVVEDADATTTALLAASSAHRASGVFAAAAPRRAYAERPTSSASHCATTPHGVVLRTARQRLVPEGLSVWVAVGG